MAANASKNSEEHETKRRKVYTDLEKSLIVQADAEDGREGRLKMAELIGMSTATADHVVSMFNKIGKGALHDHRHDHTKHREDLAQCLLTWMHLDAKLTYENLRDLINLEIFRKICMQLSLPLTGDETVAGRPIATKTIKSHFANPKLKELYQERHIESVETISRWLDDLVVSRKYLLDDTIPVNSDELMEKRETFARDLLHAMESPKSYIIFIDETELHLKKTNETVKVWLAINSDDGILTNSVRKTKARTTAELKHGVHHDEDSFKAFIGFVLKDLIERVDAVRDKAIFLLADVPDAFIQHIDDKSTLKDLAAFEQLNNKLEANGQPNARILNLPAQSPMLNLAEYSNLELVDKANHVLRESILEKKEESLTEIVQGALERIEKKDLAFIELFKLVRMIDLTKELVASNGEINLSKLWDRILIQ